MEAFKDMEEVDNPKTAYSPKTSPGLPKRNPRGGRRTGATGPPPPGQGAAPPHATPNKRKEATEPDPEEKRGTSL